MNTQIHTPLVVFTETDTLKTVFTEVDNCLNKSLQIYINNSLHRHIFTTVFTGTDTNTDTHS